MLLMLMVTSKGMAGVPRASLVVIAATLAFFNIPEAGLLLIMGIDQFLDMGRSATNVIGNSIATSVVGSGKASSARGRRRSSLSSPRDGRLKRELAPCTAELRPGSHVAVWACLLVAFSVHGQDAAEGTAEKLTGTLKKVHDSGTITLGYREASMPFSLHGGGPPDRLLDRPVPRNRRCGFDAVSDRELMVKYVP